MIRSPNYSVIEEIHEGRHSRIYRAVRVADGLPVILKRLKEDLPPVALLARLEQEFKVTLRLAGPEVVAVYALERIGNATFLVLEDCGGRALSVFVADHDRPIEACLRLAVQLAGILKRVHAAGVIHRDFNPANLIWNPATGQVKLTDFGLALVMPSESPAFQPPAQIEGTLAYSSPEQTGRMNQVVDSRADLYALGATLYALFTGHPPFVSDDPLELVHALMARQPAPLRAVRSDVPRVVSDLVMKLLTKEPDARYQTAFGVQADLERCLQGLGADGGIEAFPLARDDVTAQFRIPQRLYGRDPEIALLLEAFERVSLGGTEILLVAGYSGAGKSSLVYEVHRPITEKKGYFASGKFSQYQQSIPYAAFQQALTEFCDYALAEGDASVQRWRESILEAVGTRGQLLVDVIPALEWLIGRQPPVETISPQEAQSRFIGLFRDFLGVLCRPEHPLVLFLDDWQWADAASLQLLKELVAEKELQHLLVICAYRDNEVDASHPFIMAVDDLRGRAVPVSTVTVQNLDVHDLGALIADTLHDQSGAAHDLAVLVHEKTLGNPFFAKLFLRMLHEEHLLTFDEARRQWRSDMPRIRQQELTDNVVDLLTRSIRRLPPDAQAMLPLAASVGSRFDLQTLAIIGQQLPEVCLDTLWPAVVGGLILPADENFRLVKDPDFAGRAMFRFQHDRVQQAAYALIAAEEKPRVHHRIGQLLLAELSEDQRAERLFEVVDHVNAGRALIATWAGNVELATLNLAAARKAKSATAYRGALEYLLAAFQFLDDEANTERLWGERYDLALGLYTERSDLEYLNGDVVRAEHYILAAEDRARTPIEKAEVLHALIVQYTLLARYPEAIATGRRALATLGITLPDDAYDAARDAEVRLVLQTIGDRPVASLFDLPVMSDPEKRTAAKLLITMGPPCYRSHQRLWSVIVPKVVNLCLTHGNIPQVGYSHTAFGGLLGYVSNDYATAIQFGELATRLMTETFRSPPDQSVFYLMIGSSLRHWSQHLKHATQDYLEAYQIGVRSSNLQYAAYAFGHNMYCRFYQGAPLDALRVETDRSLIFSRTRRNEWAIDLLEGGELVFGTLAGTEPVPFCKGPLTEREFLARCDAHHNIQVTCIYYVLRTFALYVLGDYERALASSDKAGEDIFTVGTQGLLPWAEHVFVRSLIVAALHPSLDAERQAGVRAEMLQHLRQLRVWADHAPDSFAHKWLLISAELARIEGRPLEAMDLYDQAIAAASDQGFVQNEAIANECAARFWLERGKAHLAQPYVRQAHYAFGLWGAAAKVRGLEARFGEWLRPGSTGAPDPTSSAGAQMLQAVDVATIVSTAHSLSETVQLEPLLKNLMRLALAHAGADAGMLLLPVDGAWLIQAKGDLEGVSVLQAAPADPGRVPLSVVLYAARTQVPLVLSHPDAQPTYAHDPYLRARRPKSVCCLPLLARGRLIGALYLENNLAGRVFAAAQVELLRLLSSQMASAIVNAQLYDGLEKAVQQRTAELRASELRFKTMFNEAPLGIALIDSLTGQIDAVNPMFARIAGRTMEEMAHIDCMKITHPDEVQEDLDQMARLNAGDIPGFQMEKRYLRPDGHAVWISMTIAPLKVDDLAHPYHLCMIDDIAARKRHEAERESVIAQLQKAMAEVKTLRGFIPICASCKKIRDDSGYWNQIESYISEHSDAKFSHGVCPDCAKQLYPGLGRKA